MILHLHVPLLNMCSRPDILLRVTQRWQSLWQRESALSAGEQSAGCLPHPIRGQDQRETGARCYLTCYLQNQSQYMWMRNGRWWFTLLVFTAGSLAMTPVPEHGASSSTLSNPPITCGHRFHKSARLIKLPIKCKPQRWPSSKDGSVLPLGTACHHSCRPQCWWHPDGGCFPPHSSVFQR